MRSHLKGMVSRQFSDNILAAPKCVREEMGKAPVFSLVHEVSMLETPKSTVLAMCSLSYSLMNCSLVEIVGLNLHPVWSDWKSTPDNGCLVEGAT